MCAPARVQAFQAALGFLRQGRRRPGPSLATSWACGGRQACLPARCAGTCTPRPLPRVVRLTGQASGCARGMVGPEVAKGDPVRASPSSWVLWGRGAWHCVPGLPLLAPSRLLLTAEAFTAQLSPSAARALRRPCQWQRPKPSFNPDTGRTGGPKGGLCSSEEQGFAGPGVWCAGGGAWATGCQGSA